MSFKALKRHYSALGVKTFLLYNLLVALVWYHFLYVH